MRLFQRFFAPGNSTIGSKSTHREYARRHHRRSRHFRFESLEQRAVLDAASAALVGFTDYLQNSVFSQYDGNDYAIAILDTGADMNHDVFGDDVNPADGVPDRIKYQYDYVNLDDNATDDNVFGAPGHGTQVAGTIAELAPDADLIILKVLDDTGSQTDESVYEAALSWIYTNRTTYNIVAVNMSWGDLMNHTTETTAPAFSDELDDLADVGVACIASAGNTYANWNDEFELTGAPGVEYPAADPAVIAVGATWVADTGDPVPFQQRAEDNTAWDYIQYTDKIAAFSQRHATILDIFAPGADLTTAYVGGGYIGEQRGTSGAAPHITAAIALAQQLNDVFEFSPNRLTQSELVDLLQDTGVQIFDPTETDEINDNFDSVLNTEVYYKRLDFEAMAYKLYKASAPNLESTSD